MHQAAPALLLLALRVACLSFLLFYPIGRFVVRLLWRPWVRESLARGVRYALEPLALLETKRLYRESLDALGPAPVPKLNINAVTFAQLCEVEGVGVGRAREIINYRDDYGPYRRMEELGLVKGVGAKVFKVLCERFEVPEERLRAETSAHRREALTRALAQLLPAPSSSPRALPAPSAASPAARLEEGAVIDTEGREGASDAHSASAKELPYDDAAPEDDVASEGR